MVIVINVLTDCGTDKEAWYKGKADVLMPALPDDKYCGRVYVLFVADSQLELQETTRHNNILSKTVTIMCLNGKYSDIQFKKESCLTCPLLKIKNNIDVIYIL